MMGTAVYMLLLWIGVPEWITALATVVFVLAARLLSLRYNWALPIFRFDEERVAALDPKHQLSTFLYSRARRMPGRTPLYRQVRKIKSSGRRGGTENKDTRDDEARKLGHYEYEATRPFRYPTHR